MFTGARAVLRINGAPLIFAMDVSYTIDTNYEAIRTIDNSIPDELAPTTILVSLTCKTFRVPGMSASKINLQPNVLAHLRQQYTYIDLVDRLTGDTILYVPRAIMTKRQGGVPGRGVGSETWSFLGIGYWDEQTPTVPVDPKKQGGLAGALNDLGGAITGGIGGAVSVIPV